MIPKKIHYIWVGGGTKSDAIKRCMSTWKNHLKDYEIIEWNEQNFDINSNPFVKAAYEAKKWAYVSDYIRAKVIYEHGGIYLDTDVLILDNFDKFLDHRAFVGFENPDFPFTAVFGAEKGHPFVKEMLDYYDKLDSYSFDFKNNNTISVSDILINRYNCKTGNKFQIIDEGIAVYPDNILCNPSGESVSIHVFTGTWLDGKKPLARKINTFLKLRVTSKTKAMLFRKYIMHK
jgi:hypothetical protein